MCRKIKREFWHTFLQADEFSWRDETANVSRRSACVDSLIKLKIKIHGKKQFDYEASSSIDKI